MYPRRLFLLLFTTFLASCATDQGGFTGSVAPPAGQAVIYVYRTDLYLSHDPSLAPDVRINNQNIGTLHRGGYFRVVMNSGPAVIALYARENNEDTFWRAMSTAVVNLKLAPNSTHFVEFTLNRNQFTFAAKPADVAQRALPQLRPLN